MRFRNRKEKDTIVVDDRTKDIENADVDVDGDETEERKPSVEERVTALEERLDALDAPANGAADLNDDAPEAAFRGATGHND